MLTKSAFLKYLQCTKALWLYKNRRDLLPEVDENKQAIFDAGYEVESYAYELFPGGVSALEDNDNFWEPVERTKSLINEKREIIYQASFSAENLFCRTDIIKHDAGNDCWDIIEVKSSTQPHDIHYKDLSFQRICLERSGVKVGRVFLVYVNNQYVKNGGIDPEKLLVKKDITNEVENIKEDTKLEIKDALKVVTLPNEPEVKILRQCHQPYDCDFIDYCFKDTPEDSIYSIAGALGSKKLDKLLGEGILKVSDIPPEMLTTKKLERHHHVIKHNTVHIEKENIKEELEKIEYPIYYLDYETYSSAVPIFDGYRPYQRIVFQYSLHIQREPGGELEHHYFLAKDFKDPTKDLSESLRKVVGKKGSFVAWNKAFEEGCNFEMGRRYPEFESFYEDINERMVDLMEIFKKGYYVHKDFHGSASLKKVLPAVVPELSYQDLGIQEGMTASNNWGRMIKESMLGEEKDKLYKDLLDYCELDTLAMVRILEKLEHKVKY